MLDKLDRKGVIRWVRHPHHHGTYPTQGEAADAAAGLLRDAGRRLPLLDAIEMSLMEEPQPRMLKMLRGELDWIELDRANADKMVLREGERLVLAPEFRDKFQLTFAAPMSVRHVWLNMKDPLLGRNKPLRQALARLFDVAGDVKQLMGGRGRHLGSIVPFDLPGSERDTGATPITYDLAAARQLLAQAGFADGKGLPELSLRCGFPGVDWRNRFDFYHARLATAGVRLKPLFTDYPSFVKAVEASNFELAFYGWIADYPDAENFYQLLYSKQAAPGPNLASFSHDGYDKAYEASRWLEPGPQRLAHQRRMNDILRDEVPLIPLHSGYNAVLNQPWVRNHKRHALVTGQQYLDVDTARRRQGV
jgi:oligopeptide transport system substrate-binding protein